LRPSIKSQPNLGVLQFRAYPLINVLCEVPLWDLFPAEGRQKGDLGGFFQDCCCKSPLPFILSPSPSIPLHLFLPFTDIFYVFPSLPPPPFHPFFWSSPFPHFPVSPFHPVSLFPRVSVSSLLTITFFRFPASIFLPVSPCLRVNLFPHLPVSPFHFFCFV